ncbi:MAG: hypothetical protein HYT16_01090 [DPANN group archaeon]|nr:hypothetical protein [DPANN group archaeon]
MVSNGQVRVLWIVTALLLVLASAGALSNTDTSGTACASDTILFVLGVTNHNLANSDSYTISLAGDAAKWAVAAPSGFVLKPGQSNSVYIYVTPSLSAQPGMYSLDAIVNSGLSGKTTAGYSVVVDDCHAGALTAQAGTLNTCACAPGKYLVSLENTGRYSETFVIKLSGTGAQYATPSLSEVRLAPNEKKDFDVSVLTSCLTVGTFDLSVSAISKDSSAVTSAPLVLNSEACYDFDFVPDKNYLSFCENAQASIPINLQNRGTVGNSYELKVSGPSWASLESTSVQAAAGRPASANLILFPRLGTTGDFRINVEASSEKGAQKVSREIVANVLKCYATDVRISAEQDTVCSGTEKAYAVQVSNLGKYDGDFVLSASGADFVSLDKQAVKLKTGESAVVNLVASPRDVTSGGYVVKVSAEQAGITSASDELVLKIPSRDSCFGVRTTPAEQRVSVARGQGALIPIVVENLGREAAVYNLEVSGSGAAYAKLNPSTLTLGGSEAGTAYAYIALPADAPQQDYKLTFSARLQGGATYSSSTIDINVAEVKEPEAPKKPASQGAIQGERALPNFSAQTRAIKGFVSSLWTRAVSLTHGARPVSVQANSSSGVKLHFPKIQISKPSLQLSDKISGAAGAVGTLDARARNKANELAGPYTEAVKRPLRQARDWLRDLIRGRTYGYKNWQIGVVAVMVLAVLLAGVRSWPRRPAMPARIVQAKEQPKPAQPSQLASSQAQKKGTWQRFVDWLEEEDEDFLDGEKKPEDKN